MASIGDAPHNPSEAPLKIDQATARAYWAKTSSLMWLMMAIWLIFGFLVHIFAPTLNTMQFLGFPLGFYMAAQGSLIVFVVMLFIFAWRQNRIDEDFGVAEE
jgi:putative solute:sodium symporter small subunit